jgi:hypothetical protein
MVQLLMTELRELTWDESHFDEMSWHDNHVHGLRIREGHHGHGELDLDIDYILEWLCPNEGTFAFRVAPATLTFINVFDLRIEIDYAAATAGITPFSIDGITREAAGSGGDPRWTLELNWPKGAISFTASGFRQILRAPAIVTSSQTLTEHERSGA